MSSRHQGLAEVLVEAKLIGHQQLQQAQRAAQRSGATLVATLVDQGLIDEQALVDALCRRLELEVFEPEMEIEHDAVREISHDLANRYRLLPLQLSARGSQRILRVAMADPLDAEAIEELEFSTGCTVEPLVARSSQLVEAIRASYRNLITKIIPRQTTPEPRRAKRQLFGGSLADTDLSTRPVRRVQQEAPVAHRVEALVGLLVRKGLITQEEYEEQLHSLVKLPDK